MAAPMPDSEKVAEEDTDITESQDIPQQLCENNESQKDEPSKDVKSCVPATHPEGWTKITKCRKTGKTAGKFDVVFLSPQRTKLRSKAALLKYLKTHHVQINLQDFDFSVPSQIQRPKTSVVSEYTNKNNEDRSPTLSGVIEECTAQPEDHAEDTQNTEEDPFIVDENDRNTTTMKSFGRKRVRSHRKGSERALRDVTRIKRPRKYSSTKPETQTKMRTYKRKNIVPKNPKGGPSEAATLSESQLQDSQQQLDHKADDPTDVSDPVLVTKDTEDQTSTPPMEKQPETENEKTGSNSSDDDLLTSSGNSKDSITRSQVDKRKTSHYFSKKATRDVTDIRSVSHLGSLPDQTVETAVKDRSSEAQKHTVDSGGAPEPGPSCNRCNPGSSHENAKYQYSKSIVQLLKTRWHSMKDNYRRELQQQKRDQRIDLRASRMESNFAEEEQDPSHDSDEAGATSESSQQYPLSPVGPDGSNSATIVEAMQGAEADVAGPLTLYSSGIPRPLASCRPSIRGHSHGGDDQLRGAANTFMEHRQSEQSPMFHFALSLVPLLENVSEDRVVAMRLDMLHLITSYLSSDTLPRQPHQHYVYPFNYQSDNPQPSSPPPPYPVLAPSQPPAHHNLPDQSTAYAQTSPRCNAPLIPASSSQPRFSSPYKVQSPLPIQSRPTYCIII